MKYLFNGIASWRLARVHVQTANRQNWRLATQIPKKTDFEQADQVSIMLTKTSFKAFLLFFILSSLVSAQDHLRTRALQDITLIESITRLFADGLLIGFVALLVSLPLVLIAALVAIPLFG